MSDSSSEAVVADPVTTETTPTTQTTTNSDASTSATSSPAEKPAETILDRIKAVTADRETSPASEKPGSTADADPTDSTAKPDPDGLPDDEAKTLHPKTKARFGELTAKLKAKDGELDALKPRAAEYDKIDTFIRNAGLSPQDVGSTLQIAAMLRSDPKAARERLRPIMAELDRMLGETLPPELQARVDNGYLTVDDAKALNRAAADATLANSRAKALEESQRQNETVNRQRAEVDTSLDAMDKWEKTKAAGDPDWHQKQAEVKDQVELAINRKSLELQRPWFPSADESVKLLDEALKTVNDRFKRFTPKPRAIDPPVNSGAAPRSTPAPKSTMDIIKMHSVRGA